MIICLDVHAKLISSCNTILEKVGVTKALEACGDVLKLACSAEVIIQIGGARTQARLHIPDDRLQSIGTIEHLAGKERTWTVSAISLWYGQRQFTCVGYGCG